MDKTTATKKAEEIRALVKQQKLEVEPLFDMEAEEEVREQEFFKNMHPMNMQQWWYNSLKFPGTALLLTRATGMV